MQTRRAAGWRSRLTVALQAWAFIAFVALWLGFAYVVLIDPDLPAEAWAWLRGLEPIPQLLVWVAALPIAVGLWMWTSTWPPLVGAMLVVLMVLWTLAGVSGVARRIAARVGG